jgi:hypothetical protein
VDQRISAGRYPLTGSLKMAERSFDRSKIINIDM